jgi:type IV secretory pathway TrbD component
VASALQVEFGGEIEPVATSTGERFLVHTSLALDEAQAERAVEVAALHAGTSVGAAALNRSPGASALSVVLWLCIAMGLVVIFVATSLSSIESATDARIFHSV